MSRFCILLMLFMVHVSCAHHREMKYDYTQISEDVRVNLSGFYQLIPDQSSIVQLITYRKEDELKKVQVIIKKTKELVINVLSASGIELLSVRLTHNSIEFLNESGLIPREFLTFVMGHMVLVYSDKLPIYITKDVIVRDTKNKRVLLKDKARIFDITYQGERSLKSDIFFNSLSNPYLLQIRTLKYEQNLY